MRKLIYSMSVSLDGFIAGPTARSTGGRRTRSSIGSTTSRSARSGCTSADGGSTRRCSLGDR